MGIYVAFNRIWGDQVINEPMAVALSELAYIGPDCDDRGNSAIYVRQRTETEQIKASISHKKLASFPALAAAAQKRTPTSLTDPHGLICLNVARMGGNTVPLVAASDQFKRIAPANQDGAGAAIYMFKSLPSVSPKTDTASLHVVTRSSDVLKRMAQKGHVIINLCSVTPQGTVRAKGDKLTRS